MKKVSIVTLNGYFNYGNRLQNYALQEVLESYGLKVETLRVDVSSSKGNAHNKENKSLINKLQKIKKLPPKTIIRKINNKLWFKYNSREVEKSKSLRTDIFKKFTSDYIIETDFLISENNIPEDLSESYDYFVAGSDQVWNPNYINGSSIYFLAFAEKHKRIAYAPSFGLSVIEDRLIKDYKEWISGIKGLSVREDDGAKIIKELTGRQVPVLVDPTLLLSKEKWLSISNKPTNKPKGKYLLTYFLGGVPEEYREEVNKTAKENNLEIINLADIRDGGTYRTGPSEFIDYINSSSVFFTDSFHGAVFSILLEKPFLIFKRIGSSLSMYSRIDTLLNTFDLESRKAEKNKSNEDIFNVDYSHIGPILEKERNKSFDFLIKSLNIG